MDRQSEMCVQKSIQHLHLQGSLKRAFAHALGKQTPNAFENLDTSGYKIILLRI